MEVLILAKAQKFKNVKQEFLDQVVKTLSFHCREWVQSLAGELDLTHCARVAKRTMPQCPHRPIKSLFLGNGNFGNSPDNFSPCPKI